MTNTIFCPYCKEQITPHSEMHAIGDFIDCPICAAELEIISLNPFKVEYIESEK